VDAHPGERRQQHLELAESHERLAPDDGEMHGPVPAHEIEHAVDQLLALEIRQLPQDDVPAEVGVAIGVASRTPQRAFPRDLDREVGLIALENQAPGLHHVTGVHVPRAYLVLEQEGKAGCTRSTNRRRRARR
jgi:hypothetical protein